MVRLKSVKKIVCLMFAKTTQARKHIALGILVEVLSSIFVVAGPFAFKLAIDGIMKGDADSKSVTLELFAFIISWIGSAITSFLVICYAGGIVHRTSNVAINRLLATQLPILANEHSSVSSSYIQGLIERLPFNMEVIIEGVIWRIFPVLIQMVIAVGLVAFTLPKVYAIMMLISLVFFIIISYYFASKYEKSSEVANKAAGAISASTGDILMNAQRVVFNGAIEKELDYVATRARRRTSIEWKRSWLLVQAGGMQYAIIAIGMAVIFVKGLSDIKYHNISVGDFLLLENYILQFSISLGSCGFLFHQAGAAFGNLKEYFCIEESGHQQIKNCIPQHVAGPATLEVQEVMLRRLKDFTLGPISFSLPKDSFTAIVGRNGSGKSTLAKIMAGSIKPEFGKVILAGQNLEEVSVLSRHKFVLYIPQNVALLDRSLRENILYPPSQLSGEEALAGLTALSFQCNNSKITLNSSVGESGSLLSGGQVQKVELTRLTGVSVPVVILDETTSCLDPQSESTSVIRLREALSGRATLVFVTHRRQVAELSDQVLFLANGKLVAIGKHSDLLAYCTEYREFWCESEITGNDLSSLQ